MKSGDTVGAYRILEKVGEGGMGEVYRATDTRLGRDVAIKVLPERLTRDADPSADSGSSRASSLNDRRARFEREAQAVAALSHPNIVSLFDTGVHEGQLFVVMELLDGETLRGRLAHGALPVRKTIEVAVQIARGLSAAHDKGVVHRDLKPDNIFLLRDGQVKILDFGLARQATPADMSSVSTNMAAPMTQAGIIMGTVGYISPEQVRGQVVDGRADLFALGAVLYEMLSGRRAFQGGTAAETMAAVLKEDPPDISAAHGEIPPALDRIVRHCLEKNPLERFQTARDVAFALDALSGSNISVPTLPAPLVKRRVPRWVLTTAVVLAAVAGGAGLDHLVAPPQAAGAAFVRKTFEQHAIMNARFMPDGQTIVFSAALTGNAPQLFEIRPGTLDAHPFGPPRTHLLSVSSKGELAILTDARHINHRLYAGTLARMSLEGSPKPSMENVREADWSPDGETLAVVHTVGSQDRLEFPIGKVLYQTTGYISDPRISPDGNRVAFMDHEDRFDDRGWVKVVDLAGALTTLAGEFWGEQGLAWSRDGSIVYFAASDQAAASSASYQVRAARMAHPGTSSVALNVAGDFTIYDIAGDGRWLGSSDNKRFGVGARVAGQSADRDLSWLTASWNSTLSHDGSRLLFSDGSTGTNYGVVWRKTDGSPLTHLGEGDAQDWSPDEKWAMGLVYTPPQLILYPLGAGDPMRLPRGVIERYQWARFFPDGKSLLVVGNESSRPTRAFRQIIPNGLPTPLLPEGVIPAAVTPDGQSVLAADSANTWRWYMVGSDRSRPAPGFGLADLDSPGHARAIGWTRDGKTLLVGSGTDVPARIESVDITTGRRRVVADIGPADRVGLSSLVVTSVSADGRQYAYDYKKELSTLFVVSGVK